jgi:hypothetical protein
MVQILYLTQSLQQVAVLVEQLVQTLGKMAVLVVVASGGGSAGWNWSKRSRFCWWRWSSFG